MSKRHATLCTAALASFWLALSAGLPGSSAQEQPSAPQAAPTRTPLQAPVGHRQPRAADVPSESRDGATTPAPTPAPSRGERRLDSRLQICRGC